MTKKDETSKADGMSKLELANFENANGSPNGNGGILLFNLNSPPKLA